ncbi:hypothetical protein MPER_11619 [Moniliophthora perniciosa FA553]|nr:hypothetical protein MPER_11619 [Moniliophthora perniciosa FA553]
MLKWVIAFHDAFKLYGRPQAWTWDPRDPVSLMFAYPVGPHKDLLFLEREQAEKFDPREERTSAIRSCFLNVLAQKMQQPDPARTPQGHQRAPSLPPIGSSDSAPTTTGNRGPQLPPLSFDRIDQQQDRHLLTPITERSSVHTHGRSMSGDAASMLGPKLSLHSTTATGAANVEASPIPEEPRTPPNDADEHRITGDPLSLSPSASPRAEHEPPPPPTPVKDGVLSHRSTGSSSFSASVSGGRVGPSTGRTSFDRDSTIVRSSSPLTGSSVRPSSASKPASMLSGHGASDPNKPQSPSSVHSHPSMSPRLPSPKAPTIPERPHSPPASILTSPYSPTHSTVALQPGSPKSTSRTPSARGVTPSNASRPSSIAASASMPSTGGDDEFSSEAGALYYMQQQQQHHSPYAGRMPTTITETDRDDDEGDDSSAEFSGPIPTHNNTQCPSAGIAQPVNVNKTSSSFATGNGSPVVRQGTPMAFFERSSDRERKSLDMGSTDESPSSGGGSIRPLGRKPSGARAQQNTSDEQPS